MNLVENPSQYRIDLSSISLPLVSAHQFLSQGRFICSAPWVDHFYFYCPQTSSSLAASVQRYPLAPGIDTCFAPACWIITWVGAPLSRGFPNRSWHFASVTRSSFAARWTKRLPCPSVGSPYWS